MESPSPCPMTHRVMCSADEMIGETVVEVLTPFTCPAIGGMDPRRIFALRMASGKVISVSTMFDETIFHRCLPDCKSVSNLGGQ